MADEIKVQVRAEADTKALEATQAKIKELYELAAKYEAKGGMDTAAKSVRSEAHDLEKDLARFKREQSGHEKEITRERREQAAITRVEAGERTRFGRAMIGGAGGGIAGGAAMFGIEQVLTEINERQGIALRAAATRAMNARGLALAWRGNSSSTLAKQYAAEDEIAQRQRDRPDMERKATAGIWQNALEGAKYGAGAGFVAGSFAPGIGNMAGPAIGAVLGGTAGAITGGLEASRTKDEYGQETERLKTYRKQLAEVVQKQVREEDGQLEIDLARHRSERTLSGSRAAFLDEQAKVAIQRKRQLRDMGLTPEEQDDVVRREAEPVCATGRSRRVPRSWTRAAARVTSQRPRGGPAHQRREKASSAQNSTRSFQR